MMEMNPSIQQRYFNIAISLIAIILFFALFSLMVDEREDRQRERAYQRAINQAEALRVHMANGGTELYRMLRECRNEVENGV